MRKHTVTIAFLLVAALAIGLLAGSVTGPMEPTRDNFEEVFDQIQIAGRQLTAKEMAEIQTSDAAKRRYMKRVFVDPVDEAGFDLDATLADFAVRLRAGDFTEEEASIALGMLTAYKGMVVDLARWEIIGGETRDLVLAVAK